MFRKDDVVRFYNCPGNLSAVWRLLGYYYFYVELFSPDNHKMKRIGYLMDWKSTGGYLQFIPASFGKKATTLNWYDTKEPITYVLSNEQAESLNQLVRNMKNEGFVYGGELDKIFPTLEDDNLGDFYTQLLDLRT